VIWHRLAGTNRMDVTVAHRENETCWVGSPFALRDSCQLHTAEQTLCKGLASNGLYSVVMRSQIATMSA